MQTNVSNMRTSNAINGGGAPETMRAMSAAFRKQAVVAVSKFGQIDRHQNVGCLALIDVMVHLVDQL